jgi:hypothetical protein
MAKQTFTTGQVLTASQMTSLQDTALGGGAASTKTASYSLLSTDAGTTVAMNAAGATTITVDTGLFAAGDTVFIQNVGAGVCTITAGTATVDTAGALALPQYDAGILYFTSASAAIFYDYIQVGAASPLTTKGDLYTFSTSDTRLGVGANGTVLTAASGEATGLEWAAPSSGSMTQLATGTLSGTSTSISSIPGSYKDLRLVIYDFYATAIEQIQIRINGDNTTNYLQNPNQTSGASVGLTTRMLLSQDIMNGVADGIAVLDFYDYAATTHWKSANALFNSKYDAGTAYQNVNSRGAWISTAAITSIEINTVNGNSWTNGTYILYGVN